MVKYKELLAKGFDLVKAKISLLVIAGLIGTLGYIIYDDEYFDKIQKEVIVEKEEAVLKKVEPKAKKEFCESDKQYVIATSDLLDTSNMLVLDMNTFELFKTKRIDKERVGYYYRRAGAVKEWYTVFKIEPLKETHADGDFVELEVKKD